MHNLSQSNFLSLEIVENLQVKPRPKHLEETFLTDLYVKKGLSLRQISKRLRVSRNVVRKQLSEQNISFNLQRKVIVKKNILKLILELREKGLSYQKIAQILNVQDVETRTKRGKWYSKTVKEVIKLNLCSF